MKGIGSALLLVLILLKEKIKEIFEKIILFIDNHKWWIIGFILGFVFFDVVKQMIKWSFNG